MKRLFILLSLCLTGTMCFGGAMLYVDDDSPNDPEPGNPLVSDPAEDGSEAHPFDAIQQAIDAAANGDEIIILPGTYTGLGNRDIDFKGKPITVRGINPEDPNTVAATVIDCQGTQAEPHRGFHFHSGETESSVLKGLTVTNGYGHTRVIFDTNPKPYSIGGGIFCLESSPRLDNMVIAASKADLGGGLFSIRGTVRLVSCSVTGNIALVSGGGLYFYQGSVSLEDCALSGNFAQYNGGGLSSKRNTITVTRCPLLANKSSVGGAIYVYDCDVTLQNSIISANTASLTGGGLSLENSYAIVVRNCALAGNHAKYNGGGMYVEGSTPVISNCTIVGNRAVKNGGGIFGGAWADVSVVNSILSQNTDVNGRHLSTQYEPDEDPDGRRITVNYSNIEGGLAQYGSVFPLLGEHNIDVDSLFAEPGQWDEPGTPGDTAADVWVNGDYHLKSYAGRWNPVSEEWVMDNVHSPCVDAGDPVTDFSAEPAYNGGRINMGAYGGTAYASKTPSCPQPPIGDLDEDCKVTFADLALFAATWLDCNLEPPIACE